MAKEFAGVGPLSPGDEFAIGDGRITVKKEIPMNKNKLARESEERASDSDPALIGEELQIAPDEALMAALHDLGDSSDDAKVTVWRVDPRRNIKVRLFGKSLDEFMALGLDGLALEHGSGDYYVKVWSQSTGKVFTHRKVALEAPKGALAAAPAQSPDSFTAKDFIAMMQAQQVQMMSAMQGIATAMAGRPAGGEGMSIKDVLALVPLLKQDKSELGLKDVLALVGTAKDLVSDKGGGSNEFDLMRTLVQQFAGPIAEVVKSAKPATSANPALPVPAGAPVQQPTPSPEDESVFMLKLALKTLIESARTGADVEAYANMVLDHAPAPQVKAFLTDEKWWENVVSMNAEAKPYQAWFTSLREKTLALIAEDETPAQEAK